MEALITMKSKFCIPLEIVAIFAFTTAGHCANATSQAVAFGGGQPAPGANGANLAAFSTAIDHTLAVRADGTVSAWGYDFDGQCDVPAGLSNVVAVAAGEFFSLALKTDGTLVAWGTDDHGQCDIPGGLTNAVSISAGHAHSVAVRSDGSVIAWGSDDFGQTNVPPMVTNALAAVAAGNYTLALTQNGGVVAWGLDDSGQTNVPPGLTNVVSLAGAKSYALALRSDGTVVSWGSAAPLPGGLTNVASIAAGEYHGLALRHDGSVVAWGANQSGETTVPTLNGPSAIAAAWSYSLALVAAPVQAAILQLINPVWNNSIFNASFVGQTGSVYTLQYKDSLDQAGWSNLPDTAGSNGMMTLTDPAAGAPQRFYRVWVH